MSAVPLQIRDRLCADLAAGRDAQRTGDHVRGWDMLEDAHVVSQPWALWHVRLVVAGPGSPTRRSPVGNTGRARVPATQPMPIRGDLAGLLREVDR